MKALQIEWSSLLACWARSVRMYGPAGCAAGSAMASWANSNLGATLKPECDRSSVCSKDTFAALHSVMTALNAPHI